MKQYIILSVISIFACKSKTDNTPTLPPSQEAIAITATPENDTTQIIGNIKQFVRWYKENYHVVNGVKFTSTDKKGNYQVNLDECKKFLNNLTSSGYISQEYVTAWTKYFESQVEYFQKNPMNEGPPEGFDHDLVFLTQEPELVWNDVEKMTFEISKDDEGKTIAILGGDLGYTFEMGKEDGKWKIEYIATMNYD